LTNISWVIYRGIGYENIDISMKVVLLKLVAKWIKKEGKKRFNPSSQKEQIDL
jgi:hypothetical protein